MFHFHCPFRCWPITWHAYWLPTKDASAWIGWWWKIKDVIVKISKVYVQMHAYCKTLSWMRSYLPLKWSNAHPPFTINRVHDDPFHQSYCKNWSLPMERHVFSLSLKRGMKWHGLPIVRCQTHIPKKWTIFILFISKDCFSSGKLAWTLLAPSIYHTLYWYTVCDCLVSNILLHSIYI